MIFGVVCSQDATLLNHIKLGKHILVVPCLKTVKVTHTFMSGVTYHKNTGNFVAQLSTSTGRKHVGAFNNVIDAFAAYRKAKENYLVELAEKWKGSIDERAYDALISYQVSIDD